MSKDIPEGSGKGSGERTEGIYLADSTCLTCNHPFFDMFVMKSHLYSKYQLNVPAHMHNHFPKHDVNAVLNYGGKEWEMMYTGSKTRKQLERVGWSNFAKDNELKEGDGCIFEILESTDDVIRLRVVILRGAMQIPPELLQFGEDFDKPINIDQFGEDNDNPINID